MNKKSQAQVLKEVFQFGFGVIFLAFIFVFLYEYFIPSIEDYALQIHAESIAAHANYLVSMVHASSEKSFESIMENHYSMPDQIGDYSYMIFFQNSSICCAINEAFVSKCVPIFGEYESNGAYFSPGNLRIRINKNETYSAIFFGN